MAYTNVGIFPWPPFPSLSASSPNSAIITANSSAMTASGMLLYNIFQMPATGTLEYLGFGTGTCSGTGLAVTPQLQTVTSGTPSGTLYGGSGAGTIQTVATAAQYETHLSASASTTKGDLVAAVFAWEAGASSSITLKVDSAYRNRTPYSGFYNNSTYTGNGEPLCMTLGFSGGYVPWGGSAAVEGYTSTGWTSASTVSVRGMQFTCPFNCTVAGLYVSGTWGTSNILTMDLLDSSYASVLTAAPTVSTLTGGSTAGISQIALATPVNLTAGSIYTVAMEPNGSTFTDYETTFAGTYALANPENNLPYGSGMYLATKTSGTWGTTAARCPAGVGLLISAIDTAYGGIISPGNWSGGFDG